MPTDLNLALRSPESILLLKRGEGEALFNRFAVEAPQSRGLLGGMLDRLMGRDDGPGEPVFAAPQVSWAGAVEEGSGYVVIDGVAVIDIKGVLTPEGYFDWWSCAWVPGYQHIAQALKVAREDERVEGIFLRVDSPGGLVDGCFALAEVIRNGNGAHGGKPVRVHAGMACSAAYALASGADSISADPEAEVGSIGVLIVHTEMAEWLAEHGIKVEAIQSGPHKTDGGWWKALDDDARAHFQSVVDQIARRFVANVEAGRSLSADDIWSLGAQWFLAQHDDDDKSGLALGLVDEIAPEQQAFEAFTAFLSDDTGAGASAGTGKSAAARSARAGTQQENDDMSLKDQVAALRKKAAKGDKAAEAELKRLGISVKAPTGRARAEGQDPEPEGEGEDEDMEGDDDADPEAEEDDDPEAEGEDDDPEAEGEDDDPEAEDDEEEPAAKATGQKAAFALMGSKAAQGRQKLAAQLGRSVASRKLTYGEATRMLKASGKAGGLGSAMAGRDVNVGGDTGESGKKAGVKNWDTVSSRINDQYGLKSRGQNGRA